MPSATASHASIRLSAELAPRLLVRGDSPSGVIRRDLDRYHAAIETALREIELTGDEWAYLRDILNGSVLDEATARLLWAEIADAAPDVATRWGVDPRDLSERLRALPAFTCLAIIDAVERWWQTHRRDRATPAL